MIKMNSKEALERIDARNYLTEREHKEFLCLIEDDLNKLAMYESHMYNLHNKETIICPPFSSVVGNLKQEDKYRVYENNYYLLQETLKDSAELESYKQSEKDLGINVKLLAKLKTTDYIVFKFNNLLLDGVVDEINILDATIRIGRPYDRNNPNALGWEHLDIRLPEEYNTITLYINNYGKEWGFTKEEIKE